MAKLTNELTIDVSDFVKGLTLAQKETIKIGESLKDLEKSKLADPFDQFNTQANIAQKKVKELEKQLKAALLAGDPKSIEDAKAALDAAQAEAKQFAEAAAEIEAQFKSLTSTIEETAGAAEELGKGGGGFLSGLQEKLGGLGKAGEAAGGGLAGMLTAIPIPQVAAVAAAVGAVGAALGSVIEAGRQSEEALKNLQVQTGATAEEMAVLEKEASDAFIRGVGENSADAVKQIGLFRQSLRGVVPDDFLGEAAARTEAVAKSLGVETPALLKGAAQVAKQFGITYDEALNQVTAASQGGASDIEGLLDTFNEFSGNAAEAGFSVNGFRNALQVASNAGIKDLAKIGDGIKELNNRIKSGDLATSLTEVAGPIGEQLRGITQLAEEGAITAEEAARRSIEAIDKARASGQINEATRGELFTLFGGSIAEDLGSEIYATVYGAPVPEAELQAGADKAASIIDQRLADQDPIEKLERAFQDGIASIGRGLIGLYKEFVAPVINPIIDGFLRVKDVLEEAFSGEGLEGVTGFFDTIREVVSGVVSLFVDNLVTAFEIVISTIRSIFTEIASVVQPVIDSFGELGVSGEGVSGIFEKFRDVGKVLATVIKGVLAAAIKVVLLPMRAVYALVAGLVKLAGNIIGAIGSAAKSVYEWATSFDFVKDAIAGVVEFVTDLTSKISGLVSSIGSALGIVTDGAEDTADAAKAAADNTAAWQAETTKLIKANQLNDAAITALADKYEVAEDVIRNFAEANRAAILTAAGDVNQLADNFNNALAAAQSNLTKYIAAVAGGAKQFTDEARKAQAEARKLEAAQDRAQFAIDPVRQKQVAQQRAQAAAETLRRERELAAELIANAQERDRELLKISQESAAQLLADQIDLQKATIAAGGAGGPEAQAALAALLEERNRLVADQERERARLEGQFAQQRLDNLIAAEERARTAVSAINDRTITILERQFAAFNLSGDTLAKLIDARTKQITDSAEAEVRNLVQSLPEYTRGVEEILAKVGAGLINEEEAKKQIDGLRSTIEQTLLAGDLPGGDLIAQQIRALREGAALASADVARDTARSFRDSGIAATSSEILRSIDEQVAGLEDQRDLLLQNVALTAEQRAEIEKGFALAIDKVRRGPVRDLQTSLLGIAASVQDFKFEIDAEQATEQANQLADETAKINEQLRAGEITYQEAIERLNALETAAVDTQSLLADVAGQALVQLADSARNQVTQTLDYMNQIRAEIAKVSADTTITAEQRNAELARLDQKLVDTQANAYEQIGIAAASAFASALVSGEDAFKSLVLVALDSLQALIPILTAQIFGINVASPNPANVASFGAAGIAAAAATTAILQGLVAVARAAVSGFKDGGYTGNGGINDVAGVVHGREFVVNAQATAKYRDVLEAMNNGRPLDLIAKDKRSGMYVDINGGLNTVATIMADVRDRLDRIPDQAFMKQQVGVDVALDDRLYERQRFRKQVRGLR